MSRARCRRVRIEQTVHRTWERDTGGKVSAPESGDGGVFGADRLTMTGLLGLPDSSPRSAPPADATSDSSPSPESSEPSTARGGS